jgi:membrane fusion protein (multidrug efflux system)
VLGFAAGVWGAGLWIQHARTWESTDNAFIAAHIHQVSARVAGTIAEVLVQDHQQAGAGDLLARLDPRDFEVKLQQAQAQLAQAQAQIRSAEAEVAHARAQAEKEAAQERKAEGDWERSQALYEGQAGAISKQEFENARAARDAARATRKAAESAHAAAEAQSGGARAQLQAAEANVREAQLQLGYTEIRAPAAGRVGRKNIEAGNRVQPGQSLVALVQPEVWVLANFKETQLGRLRPGQPVRIRIDAFPGSELKGRIESLSPASGAQFALLPPDNATGNFTKIVQRVPVKIVLDRVSAASLTDRLVPGMSAWVAVNVGG